jgi:dihydroorotase
MAYGMVRKGAIIPGNDADLTIVDLHKQAALTANKLHSKSGWTAFEGQQVTGMPVLTVVNGQIVYREGDFFESVKGREIQIVHP